MIWNNSSVRRAITSGGRPDGAEASPALVVRGAVRLLAAVVTPRQPLGATDVRPRDLEAWRQVRQQMTVRHESRRAQWRFRKDPAAYLAALEAQLLQPSLPP